jgi:hypothetical protein
MLKRAYSRGIVRFLVEGVVERHFLFFILGNGLLRNFLQLIKKRLTAKARWVG